MARVRGDNDQRYALRASFVDEDGNVIQGDRIVIGNKGGDKNVDGGAARSVYLPKQLINGGSANG
jgi:lipopolysaccharide export system protein LptA